MNRDLDPSKDKRMIILYALSISLWPMLGKENPFFYTRYSNNNDRRIRRILTGGSENALKFKILKQQVDQQCF